jgi:DNA-binding response OmpR family regulator
LQRAGWDVITAAEGVTGLRKARVEKPDLIILDIGMPGLDGYQVCRGLRANPDTAHIPVLILTGKGRLDRGDSGLAVHMQERIKGFEVGALEFMSKPARKQELVDRVQGLLWLSGLKAPRNGAT